MDNNNTVMLGDCLEQMKVIEDQSIDMILCDLPYGSTACRWDSVIDLKILWKEYLRVIKFNAAIVLTCSQPFTTDLINSNRNLFRFEMIWEKSVAFGFVHAKNRVMKKHENILVFSKCPAGHESQLKENRMKYFPNVSSCGVKKVSPKPESLGHRPNQDGKEYEVFTGYPTSILKFPNDRGLHPTQKPVNLLRFLIKLFSRENDTILDNCAGSGTTGVACILENRNYILIERSKKYYNQILKRLNKPNLIEEEIMWKGNLF